MTLTVLLELLALGVTAAITENMAFCRGLEHGLYTQERRTVGDILQIGGVATLLTTIAGGCAWLGRWLADGPLGLLSWTRPALYVAIYGVAVILLMVIINFAKLTTGLNKGKLATRLVYGFVPLGTLFVVGASSMGALQSLIYGAGAGAGFLLAALLNYTLQKRLEHSNVPVVFRGMPMTLLTLGMVSLALFGLLGHALVA